VIIITKLILSSTIELFLNNEPSILISPKNGTLFTVCSFLFLIYPPSIILSPLLTIAVVSISFLEVFGCPFVVDCPTS
jgi:hypothetical protein